MIIYNQLQRFTCGIKEIEDMTMDRVRIELTIEMDTLFFLAPATTAFMFSSSSITSGSLGVFPGTATK